MGRPPCCDKTNVKKGLWTPEEDAKILAYVSTHGIGNWTQVPKKAGLNRCGKSCRLRWTNYLRPDLKHEEFTPHEEELIMQLHSVVGSRWSLIAKRLPGRTDNDVKNYWNTKLKKKLSSMGIDPITHKPIAKVLSDYESLSCLTTDYSMRSFNRTIPNSLSCQSEVTSIFSSTNMSSSPFCNNYQDASSFNHYPFEEMSPSSSSSSSSTISNGKPSSHLINTVPSPAYVMPPPCTWGEQSLYDPLQPRDIKEEDYNFQKFLEPNSSPAENQEKSFECQLTVADDHSGTSDSKVAAASTEKKGSSEPPSSMSSFVKTLLDRDCEMQQDFPAFDDILDY